MTVKTLRKFISYYKPYKVVLFLDLLCAAVISIVDLAYPQILRILTKTLFLQDKSIIFQKIPYIGIGLLLAYVIQTLCNYYVTCQGHIMGAKMERDMRQELFEHYERLSFSYYDRNNTGKMMSKLISDLFDISELAHHGPENLFISAVKIVGSFIFLFMINWELALVLAVTVLVMAFFSVRQNKHMHETFLDNRRKIGEVNATLQDSLSGIRVVKAFANEDIENEKFRQGNEGFLAAKKNSYHYMGSFQAGVGVFTTLI